MTMVKKSNSRIKKRRINIPYYKQQTGYTCGAASLRMALEACGIKKSEREVVKLLKTSKAAGSHNCYFPQVAKKFKLNYAVKRNAAIKDLKDYQKQDYVIIVGYCCSANKKNHSKKTGHYAVLNRINSDYIFLLDPFFGPDCKYRLNEFIADWKDNPRPNAELRWFFAVKK